MSTKHLAPLHADFVARIRKAWESRRTQSSLAGAITWSTEDGRTYRPDARDHSRLVRLAATLRYTGPMFGSAS